MPSLTLRPADATDLKPAGPALAAGLAAGFHGDVDAGIGALGEVIEAMTADAGPAPFIPYWGVRAGVVSGLCAFRGAPDEAGAVEISYFTFPAFEGQGVARAMVAAMSDIAWRAGARGLTANTEPSDNPSVSVLRRQGFRRLGWADDPRDGQVWVWARALGD